ncbi:MAG: DNA topoisomerase IB [Candidatus Rokuibacteriota bacterium]
MAGLRYVTDEMSGIRRQKRGAGFTYLSPDGEVIRDPALLRRFRALVIPPAWTSVWICPLAEGHLQVTARDARGRKVYRYHPGFRQSRDQSKFERIFALKDVLWKIRARVEEDIARDGLPRPKVMATVVWLLERTLIRVGSEQLARLNRSYGLTTMRHRHVEIEGTEIRFEFRGKSRVVHTVAVQDRRIAHIIQRCQELPGQELFQYLDDDGRRQVVDAGDVNEYLREVTGRDITAKDFRTWAGTMLAAEALRQTGPAPSKRHAEKNVVAAIDAASARLGNTRTVCRKFYVHPALSEAYLDGAVLPPLPPRVWRKRSARNARLRRHEREVLAFLKERLETGGRKPAPARESMDPVLVSG